VEHREITGIRRLSQAIAEGDGISAIARVGDASAARAAEDDGAEGLVLDRAFEGIRGETALPLLWGPPGPPAEAARAGADAWRLVVAQVREELLASAAAEATELGLECVVDVCDEEELRLALERLDPEIFLLSGRSADDDEEPLERVLDLLPDVPAGKLAIAELRDATPADVAELERAGVDGVLVAPGDVAALVGSEPPEV
jgi:hypothetical protein